MIPFLIDGYGNSLKSWVVYLMFLTDVTMFNIWVDLKCMGWWTDVDLKKNKTFTTEGITSVIPFILYSYPQPDVSK